MTEIINQSDPECYLSVSIPLPPNLEELQFANAALSLYGNLLNQKNTQTLCASSKNSLRYMDLSDNEFGYAFPPGIPTLKGLNHLRFFNVQNNGAEFKVFSLFQHFRELEHLLVGGNTVRLDLDLQARFFETNTKLRTLDLENCDIQFIQKLQFVALHHLEVLNIARNNLHEFNADISKLQNLRLLNLSGNNIQVLSNNVTDALDTIALEHEIVVGPVG